MTDPTKSDDNWAELYRELGVEDAEPTPRAPEPPKRQPVEEEVVELTAANAPDSGEEEDFSPTLESEEIGVIEGEFEPAEGESETEGEPDKKRRRRRRRRKKKGGPNGQPEAGEAEATAEGDTEEEAEGFEGEPEEEEEEEPLVAVGVEDEMNPEMTRDIIANWNVPSWQEIVAGLYRPDR